MCYHDWEMCNEGSKVEAEWKSVCESRGTGHVAPLDTAVDLTKGRKCSKVSKDND